MATSPDLELIDVHADGLQSAQRRHAEAQKEVSDTVANVVRLSQEIWEHTETLSNPVDGLSAVRQQLDILGPARDIAGRLQALQAATSWRRQTLEALMPSLDVRLVAPQFPPPPSKMVDHEDVSKWVDNAKVLELTTDFEAALAVLAGEFKNKATELIGPDPQLEAEVLEAEDALSAALQDGEDQPTEESSALLRRIRDLHGRKIALEESELKKRRLEGDLTSELDDLEAKLAHQAEASKAVLAARKDACRIVNEKIRGFYCRVTSDDYQSRFDLLKSLRTGLREPTLVAYCDELKPMELVRDVAEKIRSEGSEGSEGGEDSDTPQGRCIEKIVTEQDWDSLSAIVTSRADERLHIEQPSGDGPPVTFGEMAEGTRALAIKEVSFAASDRPVVSDQPEDSVPTRAVFNELVPTLRTQRAERQFIIVSHDANIVVGSDADHIIVLGEAALAGNLHEAAISRAALENLEGGKVAFERRRLRYSTWTLTGDDKDEAD